MPAPILLDVGANTSQFERNIYEAVRKIPAISIPVKVDGNALGRISGEVSEFNKSMEAANARLLAFGAGAANIALVSTALSGLVRNAISVNKALTDINAILGASSSNIQQFGDSLFEIAKKTGSSFEDVAETAKNFARQGSTLTETLKRTQDALILTRITGLDAQKSIQSLTATYNTFKDELVDTTQIINKLVAVEQGFAVSAKDLAEGLIRSASSAKDAGVSFEQLAALITSIQSTTQRGGPVIANALKSIFTRVDKPEVLDQLERLGIGVRNLQGNTVGAIQILSSLSRAYDTLNDSQKSYVKELVGGVYNVNTLQAALGDLKNKYGDYNRALNATLNASDAAIARNNLLNKSYASLANTAQANFEKLTSAVGNLTLGPAINNLLGGFNKLADGAATSSIGSNIGQGILKGIGNYIAGPGLLVATTAATVFFGKFASQAAASVRDVLTITNTLSSTQKIESSITALLQKQPDLYRQVVNESASRLEQETALLQVLRDQLTSQRQIVGLSSAVAPTLLPQVSLSGGRLAPKANGYIPNFAVNPNPVSNLNSFGYSRSEAYAQPVIAHHIKAKSFVKEAEHTPAPFFGKADGFVPTSLANQERNAARSHGYSAGNVIPFQTKGRDSGLSPAQFIQNEGISKAQGFIPNAVVNTAEYKLTRKGTDAVGVIPPTDASKIDPLKAAAKGYHLERINAAKGFVPNFAETETSLLQFLLGQGGVSSSAPKPSKPIGPLGKLLTTIGAGAALSTSLFFANNLPSSGGNFEGTPSGHIRDRAIESATSFANPLPSNSFNLDDALANNPRNTLNGISFKSVLSKVRSGIPLTAEEQDFATHTIGANTSNVFGHTKRVYSGPTRTEYLRISDGKLFKNSIPIKDKRTATTPFEYKEIQGIQTESKQVFAGNFTQPNDEFFNQSSYEQFVQRNKPLPVSPLLSRKGPVISSEDAQTGGIGGLGSLFGLSALGGLAGGIGAFSSNVASNIRNRLFGGTPKFPRKYNTIGTGGQFQSTVTPSYGSIRGNIPDFNSRVGDFGFPQSGLFPHIPTDISGIPALNGSNVPLPNIYPSFASRKDNEDVSSINALRYSPAQTNNFQSQLENLFNTPQIEQKSYDLIDSKTLKKTKRADLVSLANELGFDSKDLNKRFERTGRKQLVKQELATLINDAILKRDNTKLQRAVLSGYTPVDKLDQLRGLGDVNSSALKEVFGLKGKGFVPNFAADYNQQFNSVFGDGGVLAPYRKKALEQYGSKYTSSFFGLKKDQQPFSIDANRSTSFHIYDGINLSPKDIKQYNDDPNQALLHEYGHSDTSPLNEKQQSRLEQLLNIKGLKTDDLLSKEYLIRQNNPKYSKNLDILRVLEERRANTVARNLIGDDHEALSAFDADASKNFATYTEGLSVFNKALYGDKHHFAKGFVPNFSPLEDAAKRESAHGKTPVIGSAPEFGIPIGVYNTEQKAKYGNLSNTIRNDHIGRGQSRDSLGLTGSGKEQYVPNFADKQYTQTDFKKLDKENQLIFANSPVELQTSALIEELLTDQRRKLPQLNRYPGLTGEEQQIVANTLSNNKKAKVEDVIADVLSDRQKGYRKTDASDIVNTVADITRRNQPPIAKQTIPAIVSSVREATIPLTVRPPVNSPVISAPITASVPVATPVSTPAPSNDISGLKYYNTKQGLRLRRITPRGLTVPAKLPDGIQPKDIPGHPDYQKVVTPPPLPTPPPAPAPVVSNTTASVTPGLSFSKGGFGGNGSYNGGFSSFGDLPNLSSDGTPSINSPATAVDASLTQNTLLQRTPGVQAELTQTLENLKANQVLASNSQAGVISARANSLGLGAQFKKLEGTELTNSGLTGNFGKAASQLGGVDASNVAQNRKLLDSISQQALSSGNITKAQDALIQTLKAEIASVEKNIAANDKVAASQQQLVKVNDQVQTLNKDNLTLQNSIGKANLDKVSTSGIQSQIQRELSKTGGPLGIGSLFGSSPTANVANIIRKSGVNVGNLSNEEIVAQNLSNPAQIGRIQELESQRASARQNTLFAASFAAPIGGGIAGQFLNSNGTNPQGERAANGVGQAIGVGATIASFAPGPVGLGVGGAVAAGGSILSVLNNLQKSFEDLAKEADDYTAKQKEIIESSESYVEAQDNLTDLIKHNASDSQIKTAEQKSLEAFQNIKSPDLQSSLLSANNTQDKFSVLEKYAEQQKTIENSKNLQARLVGAATDLTGSGGQVNSGNFILDSFNATRSGIGRVGADASSLLFGTSAPQLSPDRLNSLSEQLAEEFKNKGSIDPKALSNLGVDNESQAQIYDKVISLVKSNSANSARFKDEEEATVNFTKAIEESDKAFISFNDRLNQSADIIQQTNKLQAEFANKFGSLTASAFGDKDFAKTVELQNISSSASLDRGKNNQQGLESLSKLLESTVQKLNETDKGKDTVDNITRVQSQFSSAAIKGNFDEAAKVVGAFLDTEKKPLSESKSENNQDLKDSGRNLDNLIGAKQNQDSLINIKESFDTTLENFRSELEKALSFGGNFNAANPLESINSNAQVSNNFLNSRGSSSSIIRGAGILSVGESLANQGFDDAFKNPDGNLNDFGQNIIRQGTQAKISTDITNLSSLAKTDPAIADYLKKIQTRGSDESNQFQAGEELQTYRKLGITPTNLKDFDSQLTKQSSLDPIVHGLTPGLDKIGNNTAQTVTEIQKLYGELQQLNKDNLTNNKAANENSIQALQDKRKVTLGNINDLSNTLGGSDAFDKQVALYKKQIASIQQGNDAANQSIDSDYSALGGKNLTPKRRNDLISDINKNKSIVQNNSADNTQKLLNDYVTQFGPKQSQLKDNIDILKQTDDQIKKLKEDLAPINAELAKSVVPVPVKDGGTIVQGSAANVTNQNVSSVAVPSVSTPTQQYGLGGNNIGLLNLQNAQNALRDEVNDLQNKSSSKLFETSVDAQTEQGLGIASGKTTQTELNRQFIDLSRTLQSLNNFQGSDAFKNLNIKGQELVKEQTDEIKAVRDITKANLEAKQALDPFTEGFRKAKDALAELPDKLNEINGTIAALQQNNGSTSDLRSAFGQKAGLEAQNGNFSDALKDKLASEFAVNPNDKTQRVDETVDQIKTVQNSAAETFAKIASFQEKPQLALAELGKSLSADSFKRTFTDIFNDLDSKFFGKGSGLSNSQFKEAQKLQQQDIQAQTVNITAGGLNLNGQAVGNNTDYSSSDSQNGGPSGQSNGIPSPVAPQTGSSIQNNVSQLVPGVHSDINLPTPGSPGFNGGVKVQSPNPIVPVPSLAPSSLTTTNTSPVNANNTALNSTIGALIAKSEGAVGRNNSFVTSPKGDENAGGLEFAGITQKFDPDEIKKLQGLNPQDRQAEASSYYIKSTQSAANLAGSDPGLQYLYRDISLNRGNGGLNNTIRQALDPKAKYNTDPLSSKELAASQKLSPQDLISKITGAGNPLDSARFRNERQQFPGRTAFDKGLFTASDSRTNQEYKNALSIDLNNIASSQDGGLPQDNLPSGSSLAAGYATGGFVKGGSGVRDDVPAFMSGGEFVIKKSAVQKYSPDFLHSLNNAQHFANGGGVSGAAGINIGYTSPQASNFALTDSSDPYEKYSRHNQDLNDLNNFQKTLFKQAVGQQNEAQLFSIFGTALGGLSKSGLLSGGGIVKGYDAGGSVSPFDGGSTSFDLSNQPSASDVANAGGSNNSSGFNFGGLAGGLGKLGLGALFSFLGNLDNKQNQKNAGLKAYFERIGVTPVKGFYGDGRSLYQDGTNSFGQKVSGIPNDARTVSELQGLQGGITSLDSILGNVFTPNSIPQTAATGGEIFKKFASGGVNGGSGTHDDVPVVLTGGEFVVNRQAVQKLGLPFLNTVNSGTYNPARGYAEGGLVAANSQIPSQPAAANTAIKSQPAPSSGINSNNVAINLNISNNGSSTTSTQDSSTSGNSSADQQRNQQVQYQQLTKQIQSVVMQTINTQQRQRGYLASNIN